MKHPKLTSEDYFIKGLLYKAVQRYAYCLKGRVLDFGAGSQPYKELIDCKEYIAFQAYQYDGKTLPFENESFDGILSTEVFEHVFNLPEMLIELYRVLKPGGYMLLTCPFLFSEHEQPCDFARYTSFGIGNLLHKAKFKIIRSTKTGHPLKVISTLLQFYLKDYVSPHICKVPLIGWAFTRFYTWSINAFTLPICQIFPDGDNLYLNNVIICIKK